MNMTAFWITWFVLSAALKLASNYKMNRRMKQIKGDNK